MKIEVNRIPLEGLSLQEKINPQELDLDTENIKFQTPLSIRAEVSKITNAVTVDLEINAKINFVCSRCLAEAGNDLKKKIKLYYPVAKQQSVIELDSDIREEVMLDYPVKTLCQPGCKGLCPKCGKNLNQGGCTCGPT